MSLGLERIIEVVREHGLLPLPASVAEVAVIVSRRRSARRRGWRHRLRERGLRVDLSLQPHRGVGDQLKLADRKGIPLAVILGASELESGTATLKDLACGRSDASSRSIDLGRRRAGPAGANRGRTLATGSFTMPSHVVTWERDG